MDINIIGNIIGESFARVLKCCFLDSDNILWKLVGDNWIGKRSIWTKDNRCCWLEDTTLENIKSYWCGGENADYTEIFKRKTIE